jgi:hypothetical protein
MSAVRKVQQAPNSNPKLHVAQNGVFKLETPPLPQIIPAQYFVTGNKRILEQPLSASQAAKILAEYPEKLPRGYVVDKAISAPNLKLLHDYFATCEANYPYIRLYPNVEKGVHRGNGMSGDRSYGFHPFKVSFSKKGKSKVDIEWLSVDEYMKEVYANGCNGLKAQDAGFSDEEVKAAITQYEMICKSEPMRGVFQELVENTIDAMVAWDSGLIETLKADNGRCEFYYNLIQLFSSYKHLPAPIMKQLKIHEKRGVIDIAQIVRIDAEGSLSPAGGWHADSFPLIETNYPGLPSHMKVTTQMFSVLNKRAMTHGGKTVIRVRPEDSSIPYQERPLVEQVVAMVEAEPGQVVVFHPKVGHQFFDHQAQSIKGISRDLMFMAISKGKQFFPNGNLQFEQDERPW